MARLGLVMALLGVLAAPAMATTASANGATVVKGFTCGAVDAEGNPIVAVGKVKIITPSGNAHIVCMTTAVETPPESAVVLDAATTGTECTIFDAEGAPDVYDQTDAWLGVVTPSGNSMLNCHSDG